jgi:hypothetical protein
MVLLTVGFWIPLCIMERRDLSHDYAQRQARRQRLKHRFLKCQLFTLFLLYPGVSSRVLALFHCTEVEGVRYLTADTSLLCSDARYDSYLPLGLAGVVLFPVGIPLLFLCLMMRFRTRLHDPSVKPWLGFLSEAYTEQFAFFELFEMAVKLILTSVLIFFDEFRAIVGLLVLGIYYMTVLASAPYVRRRNEQLQLVVQTELYLLLLSAHLLENYPETEALLDITLSIVLLAAASLVVLLFAYFAVLHMREAYYQELRRLTKLKKVPVESMELAPSVAAFVEAAKPEIAKNTTKHGGHGNISIG